MKIISEKRTFTDGHRLTTFEMITDEKPSRQDVIESQIRCGYSPSGYDGPWRIIHLIGANGNVITTWECAGSCD